LLTVLLVIYFMVPTAEIASCSTCNLFYGANGGNRFCSTCNFFMVPMAKIAYCSTCNLCYCANGGNCFLFYL
jgi:hypothetical protein